MTVTMSPLNPATLGRYIPFVGAQLATAGPILCRTSLWILPLARLSNTASDFVRAVRDDGPVVIGVCISGARDR